VARVRARQQAGPAERGYGPAICSGAPRPAQGLEGEVL